MLAPRSGPGSPHPRGLPLRMPALVATLGFLLARLVAEAGAADPRLAAGMAGVWPPLAAPAGQPTAVEVVVVTYNVRHGRTPPGRVDLGRAAAVLERLAPDLAGLQEVDRGAARSWRVDQAEWLGTHLGLRHAHGAALRLPDGGTYGNALLSRWPIVEARAEPLPGAGEPRAALVAVVETPGGPVRVVVTHLGLSLEARRRQAAALAGLLDAAADLPLILMGDFNGPPGGPEFEPIERRLRDVAWEAGRVEPTFPAELPVARIDRIYVSAHWEVRAAEVGRSLASDHLPVVAYLGLRAR